MNEDLAKQIADRVLRDNQFWIAVVGLIGSIVGGLLVIGGNLLLNWLQHLDEKRLDDARKKLLERMINASDWRKLSTLFRVFGAYRETTTTLLIDVGASSS